MDGEHLFMSKKELGLEDSIARPSTDGEKVDLKIKTTNLEDYNISAERRFKLSVLDWLNDGKVKLFRSPTEGSYLVRLLNTSLTPTDTLGRMLHTFNSTAYEIGDCTYENLLLYGFIDQKDLNLNQMHYKTVKLYPKIDTYELVEQPNARDLKNYYLKVGSLFLSAANGVFNPNEMYYEHVDKYELKINEELLDAEEYERVYELSDNENYYIYDADIHHYIAISRSQIDMNNNYGKKEIYYRKKIVKSNMYPASSVQFNNITPGTKVEINDNIYQIGTTGSLFIELEDGIKSVKLLGEFNNYGVDEGFHDYIIDEDGEVIIGYKSDTDSIFDRYENIKLIETPSQQFFGNNEDIFPLIEDVKHDIVSFYQMTFIKRELGYLYVKNIDDINSVNMSSITIGEEPIFYEDAFMTHPIKD